MRLPPEPVLVAARRWLEALPTSGGISRAQSLFTNHPGYADLTPTQYATALTWLDDVGLLEGGGADLPPARRVLAAIFEKAPPAWVRDADELVRSPDELPSDIVSAGDSLGLDAEAVYQQLVGSWRKVDTTARAAIGAAGEAALVRLLEAAPGVRVEHVAAWSDGFGYDIAVWHEQSSAHLEVKSSNRSGRFTAYLSRHEYSVMCRDERWVLTVVRLGEDMCIAGVGSVPRSWVAANVPADAGPYGSWAAVKLDIPPHIVVDGIPQLSDVVSATLPRW